MTRARLEKINQVLARRQPDLTVLLDGVHKPHNVAAILRSCDAVGVMEAHLARPRCGFGEHHMTSGGTRKWMGIQHYEYVREGLRELQGRGFQVIAASLSDRARPYHEFDYTQPTAFMMGAELFGLDQAVLAEVDGEAFIPMMGMAESLNVSVACSVLLAEARRQREKAGMYAAARLEASIMETLRFEWLHPRLAAHCRRQNKPYPPLDEEGDVCFHLCKEKEA
jgi:tRNA (guanosine-2'-O-)-methyltransferase